MRSSWTHKREIRSLSLSSVTLKYLQKCFIIDLYAILIDYREASVFQTIARSLAIINCDETVLIGTRNERAA